MSPDNDPAYNFILNEEKVKKSLIPTVGSSKKQRLIFAVSGAVVMLLVGFIVYSLLFGGEPGQTEKLIDLASRQTELVRVSGLAEEKAKSPDTRALAVTVKLSMSTIQKDTVSLIKKQGTKIKDSQLTKYKSSDTDKELNNAAQSNRYDEAYIEILNKALNNYAKAVKDASTTSSSASEKRLLDSAYNQVNTILNPTKS